MAIVRRLEAARMPQQSLPKLYLAFKMDRSLTIGLILTLAAF
jgi:hypothetical protein